jgi:2-C-methyl-D-erythritol 2,4-cyclodiphosphate synthase
MLAYRIGYGEDAHRLEAGRALWLGGLNIEGAPHGAVAHSDGDAVLHALADALLSGLALGDIGQYYPDTDPANAGLESPVILRRCLELVREHGYQPLNVALVVTLDKPKLGGLRSEIAARVAELIGLAVTEVGVSFKTSEGLATGHVQVRVTVLLGQTVLLRRLDD